MSSLIAELPLFLLQHFLHALGPRVARPEEMAAELVLDLDQPLTGGS
jgi:hypothetical protein